MAERSIAVAPKAPMTFAPSHAGILQRKCACGQHTGGGACADCSKKKQDAAQSGSGTLQRRTASTDIAAHVANTAPPIVHDVLRSLGQPLDTATRSFFEPRFGYDFSRVRIHTDARAADSARAVNALAYTVGHDIVFAAEQYAPASRSGHTLLAHELTHVIQQQGSHAMSPSEISQPSHAAEAEARAAEVSLEIKPPAAHPSSSTIQRQPADQGKQKSAAGEKREKPSAGAALCAEHPGETLFKKSPNFCMGTSTSESLHKGFRCYREIPTGSGCPPGKHICFDPNTGKCDAGESHVDDTAPTLSRDKDGMCDVSYLGLCSIDHLFTDVIPDLLKESAQTTGKAMADCHSTCEAVPWYLKGACAAGCNPMSR
jgi:hypothetical protein